MHDPDHSGAVRRNPNALIGSPIERLEDLRFLRGKGEYVARCRLRGCAACRDPAQLRCPWAHPQRSTPAAALTLPGVHAVITAADIGEALPKIPLRQEALPDLQRFEQPVIAA